MRVVGEIIAKINAANQVKAELEAIADTMSSEENRRNLEAACGIIAEYITMQYCLPIKEE